MKDTNGAWLALVLTGAVAAAGVALGRKGSRAKNTETNERPFADTFKRVNHVSVEVETRGYSPTWDVYVEGVDAEGDPQYRFIRGFKSASMARESAAQISEAWGVRSKKALLAVAEFPEHIQWIFDNDQRVQKIREYEDGFATGSDKSDKMGEYAEYSRNGEISRKQYDRKRASGQNPTLVAYSKSGGVIQPKMDRPYISSNPAS